MNNNYTFTLNLKDLVSPKLLKIDKIIKNLKPFEKFNKQGKDAKKVVDHINKSFNVLKRTTDELTIKYDKNRQSILRLKRESLTASRDRKKQLHQELRLLNQENAEIREQIRLNKKNTKASKKPIASLSMNSLGGLIGKAGIIGGVIAGVGAIGKNVVSSANIQQQAEAQVKAGMTSTGNAAGFSFDQYKQMASDLQSKSLFGDEDILKNVTAQMQTFTSISGDAFKNAQQAVLDISAKTGNNLKATSIQLGKALNDPIKGLSALTKVGVKFTDEQQKQIIAYQKAGDLAAAQAIMLQELQTEFGGSAEAMAKAGIGPLKQLGMTLGDIGEQIGGFIIPVLNKGAEFVSNLIKMIPSIFGELKKSGSKYFTFVKKIWAGLKKPIMSIFDTFKGYISFIINFYKSIFNGVVNFVSSKFDIIKGWLNKIFGFIKVIINTLSKVIKFISNIAKVLIIIFKKAFGWLFSGLWDNFIKPAIDGFVWFYDKVLKPIFKGIGKVFDWLNKQLEWVLGKMGVVKGTTSSNVIIHGRKAATNDNTSDTAIGGVFDMNGTPVSTQPNNLSSNDINLSTDRSVKNYTFNIDKLVEEFQVITNNITESEGQIEDMITNILRKAVLDVQQY